MSDIYVFSSNEDNNDYSTMGLVGALEPTECKFEETANGDSLITMKHPVDSFGKYTALVRDNILVIPVPVRTTPEIQNGSCVTTVWTYKVKPLNQLTSKNQRTLYKSSSGSGKRKVMNAGDVVTVVYQPKDTANISRWKVKSKYGTGWVDPNGFELVTEHKIEDNANAIQEVQSPWMITDQLFRIYEVERGLEEVTVSARHITYDLLYDATHYYYGSDQAVSLQTTLDNILGKSYGFQTRFHAYTNVTNTQTGLSFRGKNEIECFLDPEDGVCAKFDVDMIRDNYDLYFLHDPGINRGVRIQYGKNLTGISYKDNTEELVTRIIPTGETKNGEEFFLAGPVAQQCVDSKHINDYPVIHVYYMKCENCKIGDKDENGGKITEAVARARMRAQARKMFDSGCDLPKIEMSVEFINLGDTEEYKQFKNLENCFLYDYVVIQHPKMNVDVTAQIVKMVWDCLLDRMNSVEIGTVGKTLANTGITSWQIPSGFSGAKIAQETISSAALRSDIVAAKHIQSDTISANHIQANAVTAGKIAAGAITTDKLDAGSVTAEKIAAGAVEATKIKAGSITTDKLDAGAVTAEKIAANAVEADKIKAGAVTANKVAANAVTAEKISAGAITSDKIKAGAVDTDQLKAGAVTAEKIASKTITADLIKAKTITADSGIIDDSAIGTAQIADGSITSAKIVELNADLIKTGTLSAERLLLVGDDGVIYKINAASSGLSMTELAKDQYKNYINGTVIVAKSITAAQIAAQSITGNEILAGSITAKEINVSDLFASEATINALNAMDIRGNKYLKLYVTDAVDNISVGGRNLLLGTKDFSNNPAQPWYFLDAWEMSGEYNGLTVLKRSASWSGVRQDISVAEGEIYTLSAYLKVDNGATDVKFYCDPPAGETGYGTVEPSYTTVIGVTSEWKRFSYTFTVTKSGHIRPCFVRTTDSITAYLYICGIKLEKGNKPTDWSPAPEDIEGDVSALEQRVSAAELKIEPDAIVSTVTSSTSYKTLSSTAETAKTNAATAQSTANTAKSTADTAKSKAEGNATDITGLKTRMTTAESKIDQKADSITLSVLETKVDGISVGGRNLLRNTNQGAANWDWSMQTGGKTVEEYLDGGVRAVKMTRDATPHAGWSVITYAVSEDAYALLEPNTEYTLSFDYKPSVATANGVMFSIRRGDGTNAATNDGGYWKEIPANKWTHVSGTFTTVESIPDFLLYSTEIYITRLPTTANSVHIFKNLKLEKGNKATDWSPAPEDPAGSLSVSSNYSKVDINKDRVRIVSKRMEVAVPSEDGEDDVLRVDADGVHAEVVEADVIVSESVVRTQGAANYTPANAGELAAILTELSGKHLAGDVTIDCTAVSGGSFEIRNVSGGGILTLRNGVMGHLAVANCPVSVMVYVTGTTFSTSETAVNVDNAFNVYLSFCAFNAGVGVMLADDRIAEATLAGCTGSCAVLARVRYGSRLRCIYNVKPSGIIQLENGGEVYNATPDPTFTVASSPSIPTTQTATVTLSPTSTSTSGYGNKLYQGRYSSSQSLRKGVMLFTLPSDLTSASNIDSATLTIRRIGGVGQGGGVSVHVRCYDVPGTLYASKTAYDGQTVSIDVTSAVKAMKTNGYTGLMLYNPDTTTAGSKSYTASYARFAGKGESGAPVLKISYRK